MRLGFIGAMLSLAGRTGRVVSFSSSLLIHTSTTASPSIRIRSQPSFTHLCFSRRTHRRLFSSSVELTDAGAEAIFYGDRVPFEQLGLTPELSAAMASRGASCSTTIQALAIPAILEGKDVVVGAETGSGKTLAYILPVLQDLITNEVEDPPEEQRGNAQTWTIFPQAIVLAPNRELCEQVLVVTNQILDAVENPIRAAAAYGASGAYPYSPGRPAPELLICTPSFLAGYGGHRAIPLFIRARTLVVDEADMLMEGEYGRQMEDIFVGFRRADKVATKTQYILAAATIPSKGLKSVEKLVQKRFPGAERISASHMHKQHPALQQTWINVGNTAQDRIQALIGILEEEQKKGPLQRTMVFANTAASAKEAYASLRNAGIEAAPFHKDISTLERADSLRAFREGDVSVLVCTDLGARGIDIPSVAHVIQYEFALNVVQHLHRIGRAARAGSRGKGTAFINEQATDLVRSIRSAGEGGNLDNSFSRRRGFRKHLRKNEADGLQGQGRVQQDREPSRRWQSEES